MSDFFRSQAYDLMWELKELFDPEYVLNPGVILNKDPNAHIKFLKPSPAANPLVNRCIECGFCESNCPSRDLTLTPRQRITTYREMARLKALPSRTADEEKRLQASTRRGPRRLWLFMPAAATSSPFFLALPLAFCSTQDFSKQYTYDGEQTCAADGMCQEKCPVKINTGELIKSVRAEEMKEWERSSSAAMWLARNYHLFNGIVPRFLNAVDLAHRVVGPKPLEVISSALNKWTDNYVPVWNRYMPRGSSKLQQPPAAPSTSAAPAAREIPRKVVYVPSCVTRMMGPAGVDKSTEGAVHDRLLSLFGKAGYEVVYPEGIEGSCCGMIFNTRGFKDAAAYKCSSLEESLVKASEGGKIPIVMDTSPCLAQVKQSLSTPDLRFALYEPVEFISKFLVDKLEFSKRKESIAIHVPCSSKKMGLEDTFVKLAEKCAHKASRHTGG